LGHRGGQGGSRAAWPKRGASRPHVLGDCVDLCKKRKRDPPARAPPATNIKCIVDIVCLVDVKCIVDIKCIADIKCIDDIKCLVIIKCIDDFKCIVDIKCVVDFIIVF